MILYMKLFFAKKIQTKYNESIIPENRIKKKMKKRIITIVNLKIIEKSLKFVIDRFRQCMYRKILFIIIVNLIIL